MRALVLSGINELNLKEVPVPIPGPGEVLVAVKAAALNHRDVWIKLGQYAGLKWPCIPGSDGAGIVTALGSGVDPAWQGRDVVINPSFDWGPQETFQGADFSILGLPRPGTFADFVVVPMGQLARKPSHLTWREAAALPLAGLTAYRALFSRAQLKAGERVLLTGIGGGVALFALQFAVAAGAEVWVTSSSDGKIARAVELGARGGLNYTQAGWADRAGKELGLFDVTVDSAGGEGFGELINLAAPGGRIVFFGATRGNAPAMALRKIFWRQISLLGTTMGSPANWAEMLDFVTHHALRPPVSTTFPIERGKEAFALMEEGAQFGKIVIEMGG